MQGTEVCNYNQLIKDRKRKIFNACQFLIMDACLSLNPLLTVVYLNTHLKTAVQRRTAEKTLCADYKVSQYKYQIPFIMKFKKLGEANPEKDFAL